MVTESAEKNKKNGDICKKMRLYLKKYNISDKGVEKPGIFRYTIKAVTLIAVKREVAADGARARDGRFSVERMSS